MWAWGGADVDQGFCSHMQQEPLDGGQNSWVFLLALAKIGSQGVARRALGRGERQISAQSLTRSLPLTSLSQLPSGYFTNVVRFPEFWGPEPFMQTCPPPTPRNKPRSPVPVLLDSSAWNQTQALRIEPFPNSFLLPCQALLSHDLPALSPSHSWT